MSCNVSLNILLRFLYCVRQHEFKSPTQELLQMGQVVAYRRVSSEGQSLDRQEFQDAVKVFEETESGAKRDRPQLNLCWTTSETATQCRFGN